MKKLGMVLKNLHINKIGPEHPNPSRKPLGFYKMGMIVTKIPNYSVRFDPRNPRFN